MSVSSLVLGFSRILTILEMLFSVCFIGMEFPACTVEVFRVSERIDYPRDANGNIIAMVHPNLQVKKKK